MHLKTIDFDNINLTKDLLFNYKKYISRNIHPQLNFEFKTQMHKYIIRDYSDDWFNLFCDEEIYYVKSYDGENDNSDFCEDEEDIEDIFEAIYDNAPIFNIFDDYLFMETTDTVYINGIKTDFKSFRNYNDYLIINDKHVADKNDINIIIKSVTRKFKNCKIKGHKYRGITIIKQNFRKLDRYLIYDYKKLFASFKLSI